MLKKKSLLNEYKENKSLQEFIELVSVQEKLVDIICIDIKNNSSYERKFENVSHLFRYNIILYLLIILMNI